jgi:protein subunit release factor B
MTDKTGNCHCHLKFHPSEPLKVERRRSNHLEKQLRGVRQQLELRERQMEDAAHARVQELGKERQFERAFSEAKGRTGGGGRGTFC